MIIIEHSIVKHEYEIRCLCIEAKHASRKYVEMQYFVIAIKYIISYLNLKLH